MISKFSVKRPYTVVVGIVLVLVLGFVSFTKMKTDLLPDMTLPYAIVYTTYVGASPEEVETTVTRPIEQAMATVSNIENVTSVSSENVSTVILEFAQTANMDAVTIEMREGLDQIKGNWDDSVGSPVIMKLNPDMLPVMVAALEAGDIRADPRVKPDGKNVQRIRIVAADEIKARLLRVQQTLNGGEGGGIVKNFDCVVAGAAGKMRHGSVAIAHDTVYNFVERSVAAAGVQAHFFAGLRRLPRQRPAFAGRVGDKQFIA